MLLSDGNLIRSEINIYLYNILDICWHTVEWTAHCYFSLLLITFIKEDFLYQLNLVKLQYTVSNYIILW